jgi:site-specific DNA recombinase
VIGAVRRSNKEGRSRKSPGEWRMTSGSPPLRVVFYCRVSSDDQRDAGTVQNQLGYLREKYAPEFGPNAMNPMTLIGEYVDDGISGTLPLAQREAGAALLTAARRGDFDAVIVVKLDRLGRTARVIVDAADELSGHQVALVSASEPIDTTPKADPFMEAVGKFVFSLLANLAEFDRATLLGRTILGVRRLANEGKFISGRVPFGFTVGGDGFLAPSELEVSTLGITEADLVREIFRRVADGESTLDVIRWLNREGVPATKRYWRKEIQQSREATPGVLGWQPIRIWRMIRADLQRRSRATDRQQPDLQ